MGQSVVTIFVVEVDASIRPSIGGVALSRGYACEAFDAADRFLATLAPNRQGCLIASLPLAEMRGPELLERLHAGGSVLPVIFLAKQPELSLVVQTMKAGAFTILEASCSPELLQENLVRAVEHDQRLHSRQGRCHELRSRVARLDSRERHVWHLVVGDQPNKAIARSLGVSQRTVDRIRATVFAKLGVQSAVQAARVAMELEHPSVLHGSSGHSNGTCSPGHASPHTNQGD